MNMKGALPALILQILSQGEWHGYAIARQIKNQSEGLLDFKEGTLYPALHGLEQKGLVRSRLLHHKGRSRRNYKITKTGLKQLDNDRENWRLFSNAISGVMEGTT